MTRTMMLCCALAAASLMAGCSEDAAPATGDGPVPDSNRPDAARVDRGPAPDRALPDLKPPDRAAPDLATADLPPLLPDGLLKPQCKDHCDCPQGIDCVLMQCTKPLKPKYCCSKAGCPAKQTCYSATGVMGVCKGTTPPLPCKEPCDCNQGEACAGNICTAAKPPVYCCSKSGCPTGTHCLWPGGTAGTCASTGTCKTTCDCIQGLACIGGACTKSPTGIVYCCAKPTCPPGQPCVDLKGKTGTCPTLIACKSRCDCQQGDECVSGGCVPATPKVYCCTRSGCPVGTICRYSTGAGATCPSTGACKVNCDCYQALACVGGKCTKGPGGAVYCCARPGCPSGLSCYTTTGKASTCP